MRGDFLDSNVIVYFASNDSEKANRAETLMAAAA